MTGRGAGALLLSLALVTGGCSFATMKGPGPLVPEAPPSCTTSISAPIADMAAFLVGGAVMVGMFIAGWVQEIDGNGEPLIITGTIVGLGATPFVVSAGYGIYKRSRCREAQATWEVMHGARSPASPIAPPGEERGACRAAEPACDPGLTCASERCVRLPPPGEKSDRAAQSRRM